MNIIQIANLTLEINNQKILQNIDLNAKNGDVIAILGPNGAGKSTLLKGIMHHFNINIKSGKILFNKQNLVTWDTDQIAKLGFFYATQNPIELEGVQMLEFLKMINQQTNVHQNNFLSFYTKVNELIKKMDLPIDILSRNVNVGFSGGQKKKNEIIQAELMNPKVFLLDEIDSGLDVDAIKLITKFIQKNKQKSITFIVSHQLEFLNVLKPNKVIILVNGKIVKNGDISLIHEIEKSGYKNFTNRTKTRGGFEITDPYLTCQKK